MKHSKLLFSCILASVLLGTALVFPAQADEPLACPRCGEGLVFDCETTGPWGFIGFTPCICTRRYNDSVEERDYVCYYRCTGCDTVQAVQTTQTRKTHRHGGWPVTSYDYTER